MIAVSGIDGGLDALAKAAGMPLAVLLGGTLGSVPAYNSNGLWLTNVATLAQEAEELVAEGDSRGLNCDLDATILKTILPRSGRFAEASAMTSSLSSTSTKGWRWRALDRCHALDDQGLYWFEEPIVYDNLQVTCS